MRKVVASLFITLDGVVESPEKWSFDHFDDGMMEAMQAELSTQDTVLLGRITYAEWAGYWPTAQHEPFASFINNAPKVVVTSTLDRLEWQNARLSQGNLVEEITRLKQQPGKNIATAGSPTLVQSLLEYDLLDELTLAVYPVIAGSGKRLFTSNSHLKRLKLVNSKPTSTGVALLTYQPNRL